MVTIAMGLGEPFSRRKVSSQDMALKWQPSGWSRLDAVTMGRSQAWRGTWHQKQHHRFEKDHSGKTFEQLWVQP